jgi:sec-independent protein translocase protein TatC
MFLAFGIAFELPVVVVVLVLTGIVTTDQLREWRGYVVVGIFVVAAVVTPPDVVSQLSLAIPMCLLYEIGLLVARVIEKRRKVPAPEPVERPAGE